MALTDTFVRNAKSDKRAGQKHANGNGMYLLVTPTGSASIIATWGNARPPALGVYPIITLAKARERCVAAKRLIAEGLDPLQTRYEEKQDELFASTQTFEVVARMWLEKTAANRAKTTRIKVVGWLEKDVFPYLGDFPVSSLKPRDVLVCIQRMEARGVNESAHRVKQICGARSCALRWPWA